MTSRAARVIDAPREAVYAAFTDPAKLVEWLPPGEMTGCIHEFDCGVGGGYRMSLYYPETDARPRGKTTDREDMVHVRFVELVPAERIVEAIRFVSADAAYGGEMTLTITLTDLTTATRVTMAFDNLPPGIRPEDNDEGARQSLAQLAQFLLTDSPAAAPSAGPFRDDHAGRTADPLTHPPQKS